MRVITPILFSINVADESFESELLYVPSRNGNKLLVCDSNNMETGAITNAVSQAIGRSDNAYSMGFVYTASVGEYPHTEVTLIQASDLPEWHRYMGT